jgi:hypothetical protein
VLTLTLVHPEVFDFGRLHAWAWVVLFAGFALLTGWLLVAGSDELETEDPMPLASGTRAALALIALLLGALALALWIDPAELGERAPSRSRR